MGGTIALCVPGREGLRERHIRTPTSGVERLHSIPPHGHAHAKTNRLGKGLFGRKAGGEIAQSAQSVARCPGVKHLELIGPENFGGEPFWMSLPGAVYAIDPNQVDPNPCDHLRPPLPDWPQAGP